MLQSPLFYLRILQNAHLPEMRGRVVDGRSRNGGGGRDRGRGDFKR